MPLEKVQSVRWVQGPLQRKFKLATVHVDAAGKRTRAEFRDRDVDEAKKLFEELVIDSRSARRRVSGRLAATVMSPAVMPPASAMGVGDVRAGVPGTTVPVVAVPGAGVPGVAVPGVAVPGAGVPGAGGRAVQTDVGQPLPPPAQGSPPADEHLNGFRQD